MKSIADRIPEDRDLQLARNEWAWLMQPLAGAFEWPVSMKPIALYCDPSLDARRHRDPVRSAVEGDIERLAGDWPDRRDAILADSGVPWVVLGDIGVGKTSWVSRFLSAVAGLPGVTSVSYNHNVQVGALDGRHLQEADRLHCALTAKLLKAVQDECRDCNLGALRVMEQDVDAVAGDLRAIRSSTTASIKEACEVLSADKGRTILVVVDNVDEYTQELQVRAAEFAAFAASLPGVTCLVALRPETYRTTQIRLNEPRKLSVYPPSLLDLLQRRLDCLWSDERGGPEVAAVLGKLGEESGWSLNFPWSRDSITSDPATLRRLYQDVVEAIGRNDVLGNLLVSLHNSNMREALGVLATLLRSGLFSDLLIEQLARDKPSPETRWGSDRRASREAKETFVTAYLRGPFRRYRGKTDRYPVPLLNVFDIPGVDQESMLVGVRVLQHLGALGAHVGQRNSVAAIEAALGRHGYTADVVRAAVVFLAQNGLVRDVREQKPWVAARPALAQSDEFMLSSAGYYLLTKLLDDYASRYCEAMAAVMSRPRADGQSWSEATLFTRQSPNAIGVLAMVIDVAEQEAHRSTTVAPQQSKRGRARRPPVAEAFGGSEVPGHRFIVSMALDCQRALRSTRRWIDENSADDYRLMTELGALETHLELLLDRAKRLQPA